MLTHPSSWKTNSADVLVYVPNSSVDIYKGHDFIDDNNIKPLIGAEFYQVKAGIKDGETLELSVKTWNYSGNDFKFNFNWKVLPEDEFTTLTESGNKSATFRSVVQIETSYTITATATDITPELVSTYSVTVTPDPYDYSFTVYFNGKEAPHISGHDYKVGPDNIEGYLSIEYTRGDLVYSSPVEDWEYPLEKNHEVPVGGYLVKFMSMSSGGGTGGGKLI